MHRSHLPLLAIVAAVAACSTRKEADSIGSLARDSALVARIDDYQKTDTNTGKQRFPNACGTFTIPAATPANTTEATKLARQAYHAEVLGNIREANSLLRRASALDGSDKTAAYNLGRTSEALGQDSVAIAAYCRYLALSPTQAERAEARQRVLELARAQMPTQVATAPRVTHRQIGTLAPPMRAHDETSPRTTQPKREIHSTSTVASGSIDVPSSAKPTTPPPAVQRTVDTVVTGSDDVEVTAPVPATSDSRVERRSPSRIQGAGIGAVAGAIIGGAAGRNTKSAGIGAVAGGILGAIVTNPRTSAKEKGPS